MRSSISTNVGALVALRNIQAQMDKLATDEPLDREMQKAPPAPRVIAISNPEPDIAVAMTRGARAKRGNKYAPHQGKKEISKRLARSPRP